MANTKTKRICARVTPEVLQAMQETCERTSVTATQVVETAIQTFLANNGDQDNPVVKQLRESLEPEERKVVVWRQKTYL